jgi:diaminopimelate decarboxylase
MNIDFKELANNYQTPYYVYDFDYITKQYQELKDAFKARKSLISYAVKANSNLSVVKHLGDLGSGADCVSIGEIKRALKVGIPKYKIIFSGVGKTDDEIKQALQFDILMINVESEAELHRVELMAQALDKIARISIRVNPNVDPKTHPYISTGLHENKFGVDIDTAKRMYIKSNKVNL